MDKPSGAKPGGKELCWLADDDGPGDDVEGALAFFGEGDEERVHRPDLEVEGQPAQEGLFAANLNCQEESLDRPSHSSGRLPAQMGEAEEALGG